MAHKAVDFHGVGFAVQGIGLLIQPPHKGEQVGGLARPVGGIALPQKFPSGCGVPDGGEGAALLTDGDNQIGIGNLNHMGFLPFWWCYLSLLYPGAWGNATRNSRVAPFVNKS